MSWIRKFLRLGPGWGEDGGTAAFGSSADAIRSIVARLERLESERARYIATFSYILGRVAHADLEIGAQETRAMEREVRALGGLEEAEAVLVVEIAKTQNRLFGATENYTVTREFARSASRDQKLQLLECLFAVSAADQEISGAEESEIRSIAKELDLSHDEFIEARASFRDHIAVLRETPPSEA